MSAPVEGAEAGVVSLDAECVTCNKRAYLNERVSVDGNVYHKKCFRCSAPECGKLLTPGTYAAMSGTFFCKNCFKHLFKLKGNYDEGFGKEQHKMKWQKNVGSPSTTTDA